MKDLHIVIVSWNVADLLDRCLRSLPAACDGLTWDVVVVDNASKDGSADMARRVVTELGLDATVIANADNRGFAKACNQGIAGFDSRYSLMLNPDTECPPGSLTALVTAADRNPEAGVVGPKIVDENGRHHPSVRRFPTVGSSIGILLKLHHVLPFLPAFRRYYVKDLRVEQEQYVDQVEGSCFLIRRDVLEDIGGFDERYFIWYEEVDFCKAASMHGWKTLYAPSATVMHRGAQSFGQVFSAAKQRMFNASMIAYFDKWFGGWRSRLIRLASGPNLGIAWLLEIRRDPGRQWIYWLACILAVECVSWWTVFDWIPRAVATVVMGLIVLIVAWKRPSLGLTILLLELAIGSKGALLKIQNGLDYDNGVSLRIILLAAFLSGWFLNAIWYWKSHRNDIRVTLRREVRGRWAWIALFVLLIWAFVRGMWMRNGNLASDANAWGYLILLVPVIDIAARDGARLLRHAGQALAAAFLWLPLKTMGLLYVWSHGIGAFSQPLYLWVRRTGVAEVTLVTGNLFRVFMQSQVYAIGAYLTGSAYLSDVENKDRRMNAWAIVIGSAISVLISLSRSFWLGVFAGMTCLVVLSIRKPQTYRNFPIGKILLVLFGAFSKTFVAMIVGCGLIVAVVAFPFPKVDVGSLKDLFASRGSVTDAAAESRWSLLPVLMKKVGESPMLGSGFGATVTYQSKDPRILAQNPGGWYTTYAFEWGWLEHWIKFGILGIPVMLWLLLSVMQRVWKTEGDRWLRIGLVSSLAALGVLHIFTPYLNHPLGFGFLLAAEGWITAKRLRNGQETFPIA